MIEMRDGGFYCKVILDSMAPCNKRLVTVEMRYPRIVHAEVMTHRDRARNAASSRAIPFMALCERVLSDPFVPIEWGREQSGMQTGSEIPVELLPLARAIWMHGLNSAFTHANHLHNIDVTASSPDAMETYRASMTAEEFEQVSAYAKERWHNSPPPSKEEQIRVHKSIPNRMLEPWMFITVVMTATEWNNFFRLRCHKDAEVHFRKIAELTRAALKQSTPKTLPEGAWHRPYLLESEYPQNQPLRDIRDAAYYNEISAARCARVSYLTHDGKRSHAKDLELFQKLTVHEDDVIHASPLEHVAQALSVQDRSGPFIGWRQFRKQFANENLEG